MAEAFISYAGRDRKLARDVESRIVSTGVGCWRDETRFPFGVDFVKQIAAAIHRCTHFVAIDPSVGVPPYWALREVQTAVVLRAAHGVPKLIRFRHPDGRSIAHYHPDVVMRVDAPVAEIRDAFHLDGAAANPPDPRMPYVELRNINFERESGLWVGFSDVFAALDKWLESDSGLLWLVGSAGSGKSELLRTWLLSLQELGNCVELPSTVVYLDFLQSIPIEQRGHFAQWLVQQRERVDAALEDRSDGLLIIDNIDCPTADGHQQVHRWLADTMMAHSPALRTVAVSRLRYARIGHDAVLEVRDPSVAERQRILEELLPGRRGDTERLAMEQMTPREMVELVGAFRQGGALEQILEDVESRRRSAMVQNQLRPWMSNGMQTDGELTQRKWTPKHN